MNISNQFFTHRSLFKNVNIFESISHAVHCSKNVNIWIANKKIRLRTENYFIRDWLFIFIFRFKQSAYCTGKIWLVYLLFVDILVMFICADTCNICNIWFIHHCKKVEWTVLNREYIYQFIYVFKMFSYFCHSVQCIPQIRK